MIALNKEEEFHTQIPSKECTVGELAWAVANGISCDQSETFKFHYKQPSFKGEHLLAVNLSPLDHVMCNVFYNSMIWATLAPEVVPTGIEGCETRVTWPNNIQLWIPRKVSSVKYKLALAILILKQKLNEFQFNQN